VRALRIALLALAVLSGASVAYGQTTARDSVDALFVRREVMIPMADGVKLFTVILMPKRAAGALPFIMSRTPYGTDGWGGTLGMLYGFQDLIRDGYIFVFQDIRGKNKSEGSFAMNRPPCVPPRSGCRDEASDTWDTIEWLLHNVPNNNGRVGQLGISYPGWTTNASQFNPHPALRALSPQATMGDTWRGDDFFHQGAFRQTYGLEYAWELEASKDGSSLPNLGRYDTYDWYLSFKTLGDLAKAVGANAWPTWRRFVEHPTYDSAWQGRSLPSLLRTPRIPTLTVGGFWDQEDLYGPQATYAAMEVHDSLSRSHIVLGPWYHGQWYLESGDSLGRVPFGSATGEYFRRNIQAPWFAYWLKDTGSGRFPEAVTFDAGAHEWRQFDSWPPRTATPSKLYLRAGGQLSFSAPGAAEGADHFVSDPAHPVPYRPRPVEWTYDPRGSRWHQWMIEDQRFVADRPDVLVWQTTPLDADLTVTGQIVAKLTVATTGGDADWVVKLIDVYPDSIADRPHLGGYQLMVAGDILRGRYRQSWEHPRAIPANTPTAVSVDLHSQAYTFRRGHRIMVQVQSTWFPLYDRNPQTWVPNIFLARASDYQAQTHRVFHDSAHLSYVELPTSRFQP
jgi:putative CocE/NonD family hydrolase